MQSRRRLKAFQALGESLSATPPSTLEALTTAVRIENPWFTADNIKLALGGITEMLSPEGLEVWTEQYDLDRDKQLSVGVAMAGNIPLVGFHDALCVLISGHRLTARLSSQDTILMKYVLQQLAEIEPLFREQVEFVERLNNVDAVIATGGNNTARYFEYYFRTIPHIIRKNRSSYAVLDAMGSDSDFDALGVDVFSYFGLGCRNVSKLYLPAGYNFHPLLKHWERFTNIVHHHKYANNYEYQRSILLINHLHFYDNGVIVLKEDSNLVSPIAMLYYEFYEDEAALKAKIQRHADATQCIVSRNGWFPGSIPFGMAQHPGVSDYADGIDTMKFLEKL